MEVKNIIIPLYGGRLHVIVTDDLQKDIEVLSKNYDKSIFGERTDYAAQTTSRANHYIVVINISNIPKKDFEVEIVNSISHEVVHLCSFISKRVGLKLDVDNDEPHAYLSGWLSGEIYKTYLKFKQNKP